MKLEDKFIQLRGEGKAALILYVCMGDPTPQDTVKIVETLIKAGADVVELGMPFSDPIADGPTIQKASQRALKAGMNTDLYFKTCRKIKNNGIPLVAMTYYNIILQYGLDRFTEECIKSNIMGVIVPDLPVDESKPLQRECRKKGLDLIYLVAPTTTPERLRGIVGNASGFIYLVSITGVTGARERLSGDIKTMVGGIRKMTNLPVCIGFGISKSEHVSEARKQGADGVILGSALIDVIEKNLKNKQRMLAELEDFVRKLKKAT